MPTPCRCRRWARLSEHAPRPIKVVLNWGRRYSLWVFNFGLACCAIEFIAASMARHDFIRLGVIPFAPGPRQADLMVVSGTVTDKMAPAIRRLYDQMPEPKYVISFGACSNSRRPLLGLLLRHQGRRPAHPRRRLRAGLPAAARGAAPGHPAAAGEDRRRETSAARACAPGTPGHRRAAAGEVTARRWSAADRRSAATPARSATPPSARRPVSAAPCRDVAPRRLGRRPGAARDEGFDFFDWLSAVDQTDDAEPPGFDVVGHLVAARPAPASLRRLLLRTRVPDGGRSPASPTCGPRRGLARARDARDVRLDFAGFEDGTGLGLRPLLLPEGFEGTPLRKSFVLAARASKAWPGAKEPGESERPRSPGRGAPAGASSRARRARPVVGAAMTRAPGPDEPALEVVLRTRRRAGRLPGPAAARRADRAQGDGPHAGPARPDVRRRLPRVGPAGRRRGEVRPEGGHHPGRRGPAGLQAGARPSRWCPTSSRWRRSRCRPAWSPPTSTPACCSCSPPRRSASSAP